MLDVVGFDTATQQVIALRAGRTWTCDTSHSEWSFTPEGAHSPRAAVSYHSTNEVERLRQFFEDTARDEPRMICR